MGAFDMAVARKFGTRRVSEPVIFTNSAIFNKSRKYQNQ